MTHTILAITLAAASLIDVAVQRVNDRRSLGHFSQLDITVNLPKIKNSEIAGTRVVVTSATDETGLDLLDPERQGGLETHHYMPRDASSPASVSVTLKNPARHATKVKEVRGEIELYMPAKDPNSVADVAKFLSFSGKPLAHKALAANGIEIALVSPTQLAAEKKKLADAKRKEYAEVGYEGESLDSMVSSYTDSLLAIEENDVLLRVKDPGQRIQEMVYVDGAGEVKRLATRDDEGFVIVSTWEGKPQPDWKLRVSMRTAKNVVKHAFVLKDVPLP